MKKSHIALLLVPVAVAGCRTVGQVISDYRENISRGRYCEAAGEPAELAAKGGGDSLMWHLMAASAYDLSGDVASALSHYDFAEDTMDENDKRSVFSQSVDIASAMMLNDKFFPYDGGGQDRIFTCLYKAIDYGSAGKNSSMRTELNRAAEHQEMWLDERSKNIAAAQERLEQESAMYVAEKGKGLPSDAEGQSKIAVSNAMNDGSFAAMVKEAFGFDIFTSGVLNKLKPADYQNPYLSHVCGIFRWLSGDGGYGHLRDANSLRPKNAFAAKDRAECEAGARPKSQVWVYVEDGLCPEREEWRIDLPLMLIPYAERYVKYAGLCLPRLRERQSAADFWLVDGTKMQLLADVDALVKIEYDVYMRGAIAREITRTVIDVGIQVALGMGAEGHYSGHSNRNDSSERMAYTVAQYAVAAYSMAKRGADIRSWSALPKRVYLARVPAPAGGVLNIKANGITVAQVTVPRGNSMVFVRKPGAAAPCVTRVVKLD